MVLQDKGQGENRRGVGTALGRTQVAARVFKASHPASVIFTVALAVHVATYLAVMTLTPFGSFYNPDSRMFQEQALAARWAFPENYGAFIGLIYRVLGAHVLWPVALNLLAASGTAALVYSIVRHLSRSARAGVVMAALVILSPYQGVLATQFLRDSLIIFTAALTVWAAVVRRSIVLSAGAVIVTGWLRYRYGIGLGFALGTTLLAYGQFRHWRRLARPGLAIMAAGLLLLTVHVGDLPGQYLLGGSEASAYAVPDLRLNEYGAYVSYGRDDFFAPRVAVGQEWFLAAPLTAKAGTVGSAVLDFFTYPRPVGLHSAWEYAFSLHMVWWYAILPLLALSLIRKPTQTLLLALPATMLGVVMVLFTAAPGPIVRWREPMYLMLLVSAGAGYPWVSSWKRAVDVTAALIGMVLFAPVAAVIFVSLWAAQRHIIYRQRRIGLHGQPFTVFKFCTMRPGSEGRPVTADGDDRVTRMGHILRTTALDELPQLWNILRGDMSLVGPRPLAVWENMVCEASIPGWAQRYAVRPGLTGLGQLRARKDHARRLQGDLEYIAHACLWMDTRIVAASVVRTFTRRWRQDC